MLPQPRETEEISFKQWLGSRGAMFAHDTSNGVNWQQELHSTI